MCPMCERNLKKQELEHFVKLNSSRSEKFTANQRSKKFDSSKCEASVFSWFSAFWLDRVCPCC